MEHTKEPWAYHETRVYLGRNEGGFDISACPSPEANARRIVACVNFCAGADDTLLHHDGLRCLVEQVARLTKQRNELLALLRDDAYAMTFQSLGQYRSALIKAAIAAAKECERVATKHADFELCAEECAEAIRALGEKK
jgi:hypothetical protein